MTDKQFKCVVLGLGLVAGWLWWQNYRRHDTDQILLSLRRMGARVEWDEQSATPQWIDVDFSRTDIADDELAQLPATDRIEALDLSNTPITDHGLVHLQRLPGLRRLHLDRTHVTDEGLRRLRHLARLEELTLQGVAVTDAGLDCFQSFPRLARLDLTGTPVSDAGLRSLGHAERLTEVVLNCTQVTDAGVTELASLPRLQTLELGGTRITDASLSRLADVRSLRSLILHNTAVTDHGLAHLAKAAGLRKLDLEAVAKITDAGMVHLQGLAHLESLVLTATKIGDPGLAHLSRLDLRKLDLAFTRVTDAGLDHLLSMHGLQDLRLDGYALPGPIGVENTDEMLRMQEDAFPSPGITDKGLQKLCGLSGLQALSVANARITDAGLEAVAGLPRLQKLNLQGTGITDAGLPRLRRLTNLRKLDLGSTAVTGAGLESLAALTDLQRLYLARTDVDDAGLRHLTGLARLRTLDLSVTDVTDAALANVRHWPQLRRLYLQDTPITDARLADLKALPDLRDLDLSQTKVTDAGLEPLTRLPNLEEVRLFQTAVTKEGIRAVADKGYPVHFRIRAHGVKHEFSEAEEAPAVAEEPTDPNRLDALGDPLPRGARLRLGTSRLHHASQSVALALRPDCRVLASAGDDGRVCLWDTAQGRLLHVLRGIPCHPGAVAFSPDGKWVAAGDSGGRIFLWDATTGRQVRVLQGQWFSVLALAFAPDGKSLAFLHYPATVQVFDLDTMKETLTLHGKKSKRLGPEGSDQFRCLAFAPDGKTLAAGGAIESYAPVRRTVAGKERVAFLSAPHGCICLWDIPSGQQRARLTGHEGQVQGLAFAPDGRTLVSSGGDRTVRVWEADTGNPVRRLDCGGKPGCLGPLALSPDGKIALVGRDFARLDVVDLATGHVTPRPEKPVSGFALSADGKMLATADFQGFLSLWDAATGGRELVPLPRHKNCGVTAVAFAPDGRTVASAGSDGTVRLWDAATAKEGRRLDADGTELYHLHFSPDGRRLAASGYVVNCREKEPVPGRVVVWDVATGARVFESPEADWAQGRPGQVVIGRGDRVAVVRNVWGVVNQRSVVTTGAVWVYDIASGRLLHRFEESGHEVHCLALSPDDRTLAWGTDAATVHLVEVATGKGVARIQAPAALPTHRRVEQLAFAPAGASIAFRLADQTTFQWDLSANRPVIQFRPPGKVALGVLGFAPGGRLLVGGDVVTANERAPVAQITVWDAATGKSVCQPARAKGDYTSLALSPAGAVLASGHASGVILLWDLMSTAAP